MASSSIIATCKRRGRYMHISAPIIPKGTQIGVDKTTNLPILASENMVGAGVTYRKSKD